MAPLESIGQWPGLHGAAVVVVRDGSTPLVVATAGALDVEFPLASVTKVASSLAVLGVVAAGGCALDDEVGPPGASLAHLLSHASGLPLDGMRPIAQPGERRIYSNTGIELAVSHAASSARVEPRELLASLVFEPLGMSRTRLEGSAASAALGTVADLSRLAGELLVPSLLPIDLATRWRTVAFAGLAGVLPGFGRQVPCDFGLGIEVKGTKHPHWTGERWPASSVGHFGQRGGFVVADAASGIAVATLGDEPFGAWASARWPGFTDDVRREWLPAASADPTTP
jgi:CubicO group peptidase (beta-lactamase class C family)